MGECNFPIALELLTPKGDKVSVTVKAGKRKHEVTAKATFTGNISVSGKFSASVPIRLLTSSEALNQWAVQQVNSLWKSLPRDCQGVELFQGMLVVLRSGDQAEFCAIVKESAGHRVELHNGVKAHPGDLEHIPSIDRLSAGWLERKGHQRVIFYFAHTEHHVPPGCKNAKDIGYLSSYGVYIPILTDVDAPICLIETTCEGGNTLTRRWRWFNGKLWINHSITLSHASIYRGDSFPYPKEEYRFVTSDPLCDRSYRDPEDLIAGGSAYNNYQDRIQRFEDWAKSLFLLDGEVWRPTTHEPRLWVGFNSSKFCTTIEAHYEYVHAIDSYFRVDQQELALAAATTMAKRLEGKTLPIQQSTSYEILIPECIQLNPVGDGCTQKEEYFQRNYQRLKDASVSCFQDLGDRERALASLLAEVDKLKASLSKRQKSS